MCLLLAIIFYAYLDIVISTGYPRIQKYPINVVLMISFCMFILYVVCLYSLARCERPGCGSMVFGLFYVMMMNMWECPKKSCNFFSANSAYQLDFTICENQMDIFDIGSHEIFG